MTTWDWMYGIWFCANRIDGPGGVDWMCQLYKAGGKWVIEYRFRYYSADSKEPFDEKDRKSWYMLASQTDSIEERDVAITGINKLVPVIEAKMGSKADFVLLDCSHDDPKFFFELGSRPWAHFKRLPPDDAK